jgi:hypothetical protein
VIVGATCERFGFPAVGTEGLEDAAFADFSNRGLMGPRGARRFGKVVEERTSVFCNNFSRFLEFENNN